MLITFTVYGEKPWVMVTAQAPLNCMAMYGIAYCVLPCIMVQVGQRDMVISGMCDVPVTFDFRTSKRNLPACMKC